MANFCSQCGAPLPEGAKFCGKCGKKIEEVLAENITQPPSDNVEKSTEQAVRNNAGNVAIDQNVIAANAGKINDSAAETFSEKTAAIQPNIQEGEKINNQAMGDDKTVESTGHHLPGTAIGNDMRKVAILPDAGNGQFAFSDNDKLDPANDVTIKEKYFNYKGRLNRKRYFFRTLIASVIFGIVAAILALISPILAAPIWILSAAVGIMLGIRRCHDLDKSGWFYLLIFIPIVNFFVALYLLFAIGTIGPNQYGPDPLAREHLLR